MKHIFTKIYLVLFAVFIAGQIFATSFEVSGKVTEKATRKALEGVNVMIEGSTTGTVTNREGHFHIHATDGDILVFSYIGFKKHRVKIAGARYLDIKLEVKASNLNAITVSGIRSRNSAVKVDVPVKEIPLTVNIVTSKTLEERNVTNMVEAVKNVNGVRAINRYGGFQTFRFRGFNNFVMLVDGVRDERHNHSTSAPQTNLANVETIEVVKGPESVLYGHSALGGIINVVRKRPTIDEKYNVSVSYGSFNSKTFNAGIGGSISENLRYRTDFGLTETDGWRDFGQKTANGYLALSWDVAKNQNIEIQVGANRDKYDTDTGIPVLADGSLSEKVDISTRYNDPADFLKHKRYDFQLSYENRISDDLTIRNKASYYFDDIDYFSTESLSYNEAKDSLKRTYPFYFNHQAYPFQNQLEMVHNFNIGKMKNKFLAGYSLG
ncbi:MAG: TonB-dependent receptor plug domain-containing protein, partial [Rhodothermaceae bacterium]